MSIVSRIFSSRSSSRINARLAFFMDNLFAIGFGLGLRFVIDNITHHDFKLTSILVGLWEGVVTLHFLRKMPRSLDPYIAYATRLLVDFLVTENMTRLILVVVWTGLGMVLADITPAIWHDVGGRRKWRRVRRDLYYMTRSIPTLPPIFPRARVVRFSPVTRPTEISESVSTGTVASQVPKSEAVTSALPPRVLKRPIPGALVPSVISETDSEVTSAIGARPGVSSVAGTSHAQFTIRKPAAPSVNTGSPTASSIDDSNLSSESSTTSTPTVSQGVDIGYQDENEVQVPRLDKGKGREMDEDSSGTPTRYPIQLPPTPSDSYRPHPNRSSFVPTITGMPSIPDFFESGLGSDWENIRREEADTEQPSPPSESEAIPPPVQYEPTYTPSVYEPTPRPETFDRDLWDDVSNAAPPTPYTSEMPPQRPSRPPPPSMIPRSISAIPQPVKKIKKPSEPVPPPPVPQTPLYGDAWDTEKDQLPPPTPEVSARTPMNDTGLDLNQDSYTPPAESAVVPPVETESQEHVPVHQDAIDPSASFDDPWANSSQPLEPEVDGQQDIQQQPSRFTSTPQHSMLPTPQMKAPTIPPTPQQKASTVPPTPQQKPGSVPPTPHKKTSCIPATPQQKLAPVPPTPQQKSVSVPPTPQQRIGSVHPTPNQQPAPIPPTPQQRMGSVPPTPHQQPAPVPPTPQQRMGSVPPTPQQQPAPVPPTPQQRMGSVPPTPHQQPAPVPPTPQQRMGSVPPTPHQQSAPVPPTPQQRMGSVPPTPQHQPAPVPPTPQQQPAPVPPTPPTRPSKIPSTPKQKGSLPPPTPQQKSSSPLPPTPQPTLPSSPVQQQQEITDVHPPSQQPVSSAQQQQMPMMMSRTPKIWSQTMPPSPRPRNQPVPQTPSQRSRTVPSTPQHLNKPVPPTPLAQNLKDWDDLSQKVMRASGGDTTGVTTESLRDSASQQVQPSHEGDLVDLGGDEDGAGNGHESPKNEGGEEENNGSGGNGTHTPEDDGFVQVDADNNPLSPASSGYSSIAGVPSEIKERNKQAIIIRAQIEEMSKTINRLKEEKLMAQGKEELDPLSEESTLKEQEIRRAEKSLEKLVKRAEKRYQAAVESTQQLTVPKTLNLNFDKSSPSEAAARLEDVIGLFFNADRKNIGLSISLPKGGPGKSVKASVTKVLEEYGLKSIPKMSGMSVNMSGKPFVDMVSAFRQKHAKDDS